jgi:CRP-like cAMP-binding protein
VDEREIAACSAGMHVGEIGLLEPFKGRSATIVATDTVVVVTAQQFTEIAKFHPDLWRRIAIELCRRLVRSQALIRKLGAADLSTA